MKVDKAMDQVNYTPVGIKGRNYKGSNLSSELSRRIVGNQSHRSDQDATPTLTLNKRA